MSRLGQFCCFLFISSQWKLLPLRKYPNNDDESSEHSSVTRFHLQSPRSSDSKQKPRLWNVFSHSLFSFGFFVLLWWNQDADVPVVLQKNHRKWLWVHVVVERPAVKLRSAEIRNAEKRKMTLWRIKKKSILIVTSPPLLLVCFGILGPSAVCISRDSRLTRHQRVALWRTLPTLDVSHVTDVFSSSEGRALLPAWPAGGRRSKQEAVRRSSQFTHFLGFIFSTIWGKILAEYRGLWELWRWNKANFQSTTLMWHKQASALCFSSFSVSRPVSPNLGYVTPVDCNRLTSLCFGSLKMFEMETEAFETTVFLQSDGKHSGSLSVTFQKIQNEQRRF